MINIWLSLPADDADVLGTAGSNMRRAPADGQYRIWYGSDQVDGQVEIKRAGESVLEPSEMPLITVGVLPVDGPPKAKFNVAKGQEVLINYNEVTGGTASMHIQFHDVVDLMLEQGFSPLQVLQQMAAMAPSGG